MEREKSRISIYYTDGTASPLVLTSSDSGVSAWGRDLAQMNNHLARQLEDAQNIVSKQEETINYYKGHVAHVEARLRENAKTIKAATDGVQQLKEALAHSEQNRRDLETYIKIKEHGLPSDKMKRRMRI